MDAIKMSTEVRRENSGFTFVRVKHSVSPVVSLYEGYCLSFVCIMC